MPDHWVFTYRASDGQYTADASVMIDVTNAAPTAQNDNDYETKHDTLLSVPAPGVKYNDAYDPDGDPLTAVLVSGPSHAAPGGFQLNPNGSFDYTPAYHYVGNDSFQYKVNDGIADSNTATATIEVWNIAPIAVDDGPYEAFPSVPLVVEAPGVLGNDYDPDGDYPLTAVLASAPAHGTLEYFRADGSFKYLCDPDYADDVTFTYYANDGLTNSLYPATVTIHDPPMVDLAAKMVLHNVGTSDLPENQENYPGAYVPLNDDDDDYDAENKADTDQYQNESGPPIAGESDLLPIVLHAVRPVSSGGWYQLHRPGNVRVWRSPDRSGEVADLAVFVATVETPLYVEGVSAGAGLLYVDWWNSVKRIDAADVVAVTVFEWVGPLNVPDHSIHRYTATGGAPGMDVSKWLAPVNGSVNLSVQSNGTDDQWIKWNAGPEVGKAVYQAHPNYIWDLEANLVQIVVEAPPPAYGPAFETGTPCDDGVSGGRPDGMEMKVVASDFNEGIVWAAKVTLNGPNGNRGVKFMRIAFVQVATAAQYWGDYTTATMTLTSSLQGVPYPDCVTEPDRPYYRNDVNATFFNPMSDGYTNWKVITADDSPSGGPPLRFDQTDDIVDTMDLVWTFDLYVTAQTADNRNNALNVYTTRATAQWEFNGSGTVAQSAPYDWTGTGAAVTVRRGWTPETSGSEPPFVHTNQTRFNAVLNTDTWQ